MQLAAILMLGQMVFMLVVSPLGSTSPAALLAGAWAFIYVLQSIFASDMTSSFLATITIFTITLSFSAGELIGCGGVKRGENTRRQKAATPTPMNDDCMNSKRLKWVILCFGLFGILGVVEYANVMGLLRARSLAELILLPGIARVRAFSGDLAVPMYSKIVVLFAYPGVVLALAYYYLYRWRWWLVLPMIEVLLFGMIQSGRAGAMIVLLQVVISVYLKQVISLKQSAARTIVNCAVLPGGLMAIVFLGGQFLREGFNSTGIQDLLRVTISLRLYLFGGVSAYSYWISHVYDWDAPTLGKFSFSSLFSALGIAPQVPGVYAGFSPISASGETTNLYTSYRSFIDDYSIVGACLFYFVAGIVIASITRSFMKGKVALIAVLIPLLSWLAYSPMYSLTYFNSFLLSCFLPYILVRRFSEVKDGGNKIHLR
jgi:oligosaccharide repeat unit polymerase